MSRFYEERGRIQHTHGASRPANVMLAPPDTSSQLICWISGMVDYCNDVVATQLTYNLRLNLFKFLEYRRTCLV